MPDSRRIQAAESVARELGRLLRALHDIDRRRVETLVFSHNDPGIEHVLVDPDTLAVTGIIDWSDAALTDPARDFGLLLGDLGTAALTTALETYAPSGATSDLLARASFYARCALLEDLAYGVETGRDEYAAKSLAGLEWLFA